MNISIRGGEGMRERGERRSPFHVVGDLYDAVVRRRRLERELRKAEAEERALLGELLPLFPSPCTEFVEVPVPGQYPARGILEVNRDGDVLTAHVLTVRDASGLDWPEDRDTVEVELPPPGHVDDGLGLVEIDREVS